MKQREGLREVVLQYARVLGDLDEMGHRKAEEFCKELFNMVKSEMISNNDFRDALTILSKERKFQETVDAYASTLNSMPSPSSQDVFSWV